MTDRKYNFFLQMNENLIISLSLFKRTGQLFKCTKHMSVDVNQGRISLDRIDKEEEDHAIGLACYWVKNEAS